jgi:hypothetical protein
MMKKLMSKKANIFGKKVSVFVIALIAVIGIASAMLVPYLSGMITGNVVVESPLAFSAVSASSGTCTVSGSGSNFSCPEATLHGGENYILNETLTNNADVDSPHFYTQVKVPNFDGIGITVIYTDVASGTNFTISPVVNGTDTYYKIGPVGGYPAHHSEAGRITVITFPNLQPRTYNFEAGVVLA